VEGGAAADQERDRAADAANEPDHPVVLARLRDRGDRHEVDDLADAVGGEEPRQQDVRVGRYICRRRASLVFAAMRNRPPFRSSRIDAKTDGESKWGRHSQSIDPSVPIRAAVWRSPMTPWCSIGR
jgi:hypothetical protein